MADGDSLKRSSGSSQAALSLLFSLEPGDIAEVRALAAELSSWPKRIFTPLLTLSACLQRLSSSVPEGLNEYDPVTEVQRIKAAVASLSEPECKVRGVPDSSSCSG
jgi:hypothetical protein